MIARLSHVQPLRIVLGAAAVLFVSLALSGCGDSYPADMVYGVRTDLLVLDRPQKAPASFGVPGKWPILEPAFSEANGYKWKVANPKDLTVEQRSRFDKVLTELFGTPAAPKVAPSESVDEEAITRLGLTPDTLAAGSKLYRRHCLHCHGLTGDGHGPTAAWVNPHPRDYRQGVFKFTSSGQQTGRRKPRREDLLRVLHQGIEGTSMPSFGLLPEDELQKLVSYVIHLSIRGQTEFNTMRLVLSSDEKMSPEEVAGELRGSFSDIVSQWLEAEGSTITPQTPPRVVPANARTPEERKEVEERIARGYQLFTGGVPGTTSCISCHIDYGRRPNLLWDDWGTVVRPADLTAGIYRGGRRPIDLFWRVHSGVNGAGMPAVKDIPENDLWDIVNFVLALPYPKMLPEKVRNEIYPQPESARTHAALKAE